MLYAEFKTIQFDERIILPAGQIDIPSGLTLLLGESGSGKTTLMKTLSFQNAFLTSFQYQNIQVNITSDKEKQDFIFEHISFLDQNAQLLENLTIQQQIQLIQTQNTTPVSMDTYNDILNFHEQLNKYPNQLSGGERKRAALLCAIARQTDILFLDEPTANLDEVASERMRSLFQLLKQEGKTLFIATHDEQLKAIADQIYEVDHGIKVCKKQINNHAVYPISHHKDIKALLPELRHTHQYQKTYHRIFTFLAVLCVAFCTVSLQLQNFHYDYIQNKKVLDDTKFLIYAPDLGMENQRYEFYGAGKGISSNQIQQVTSLAHVKSAKPWFQIELHDDLALYEKDQYGNEEKASSYKKEMKINYPNQTNKIITENALVSCYDEADDHANIIKNDFHQNGIFISQALANSISTDENTLKQTTITFSFLSPKYLSDGYVSATNQAIPITYPACTPISITTPIAGVLKGNQMDITPLHDLPYAIYMKQTEMMSYIDQTKQTHPETLYTTVEIANDGSYQNYHFDTTPPKDTTRLLLHTIDYEPWEPTRYLIEVDDANHVSDVISQITKLGYNVYQGGKEYHTITENTRHLQSMIRIGSLVSMFIILVLFTMLKYNDREAQQKTIHYFTIMGYQKKEVKEIMIRSYTDNTVHLCIYAMALIACILLLDQAFNWFGIQINLMLVATTLLLSIILEFIIPYLIKH